jgi:surface protein
VFDATSFNQDLSDWDVSSVTNMSHIFDNADALSDGAKCVIHMAFSSNENWPYDWSGSSLCNTYVPDDNFEQKLIDWGYDDVLDDSVFTPTIFSVTSVNLFNLGVISDLTGIEDFTALTYLNCGYNQLTSLDVSNNTALTTLHCNNNQLTSLNGVNSTVLTELRCDDNQLTSLDVSNNTALDLLYCENNELTSLDVSSNPALTTLNCSGNELTSIAIAVQVG